MSRRRISIKDLGVVDCQGWLLRRREGRSFLVSKWKRYWFVLKRSSLYWYNDKTAEKAEGFINLSGFTIEPAKQCRKKQWIGKLSEAAEPCELINAEECYSEGSDQDGDECVTSGSLEPEQETAESENGDVPQPLCESPSSSVQSLTPTGDNRGQSSSDGPTLCRNRRRRAASDGGERRSWVDLPGPDGAGAGVSLPLIHVGEESENEAAHEKPPDELERLYNHLKAASLSPIGQSSRKDFRASFIRRCKNEKINEKLHLLRILRSTLKAKELELQAIEQILTLPTLTAPTYRKWRLSNSMLLQEISQRNQAAGGAAELTPPDASAV
ncbi:LOW QUALITY PROTEIN: interactor protein for cytohesin exchange factors 1 [Symphorus nematophorus]